LRVSTDYSDRVRKAEVESGNPFLALSALENLRTWRFAKPDVCVLDKVSLSCFPRTFEVTYNYQIVDDPKVDFLKEPSVVDIAASLPVIDHGGDNADGEWPFNSFWQAELRSPSANTTATLFFEIENAWPDGYVIGPAGKKQKLRKIHQDGDMLGFDMTVQGTNGKPLNVTLVGKKTGNKMSGVFLDYSGTPGTWTAVRQPPAVKPTR
jgi:hypothetical protein